MKRPDQDRFDLFARHFESMDAVLVPFCKTHNFQLERNHFRQPSRTLKRAGNPVFLIDIRLSEYWLKMDFSNDMSHTIDVIGYYEPPNSQHVWRIAHNIAKQERYSSLQTHLSCYLEETFNLVEKWTPEIIMQQGKREENLKQKYGT